MGNIAHGGNIPHMMGMPSKGDITGKGTLQGLFHKSPQGNKLGGAATLSTGMPMGGGPGGGKGK